MNDTAIPQKGKNTAEKELILVLSTAKNQPEALKLAELLLKEKAAACVSVSSPVTSVYRWKGNIETEQEVMLFIKTVRDNYHRVERLIRENHSYEVPEIIAIPIIQGEGKYLQWMIDNTAA
ncbi:MAG: divalent-cation tolerance protein CutA [Candidatus Aminicenantes bacterium]|nr:divalent-cation tolerance protein CutA [Candidatus Aminicenantes bacterium]